MISRERGEENNFSYVIREPRGGHVAYIQRSQARAALLATDVDILGRDRVMPMTGSHHAESGKLLGGKSRYPIGPGEFQVARGQILLLGPKANVCRPGERASAPAGRLVMIRRLHIAASAVWTWGVLDRRDGWAIIAREDDVRKDNPSFDDRYTGIADVEWRTVGLEPSS
jgi:hypothetical protein